MEPMPSALKCTQRIHNFRAILLGTIHTGLRTRERTLGSQPDIVQFGSRGIRVDLFNQLEKTRELRNSEPDVRSLSSTQRVMDLPGVPTKKASEQNAGAMRYTYSNRA